MSCEFPALERQNSKLVDCQMSPVIVFRLNTIKGTAEAPDEELLRLNILTPSGVKKAASLTPERYDEHPCPLNMAVPPRGSLTYGSVSRTTSQFVFQ